MGAAGEQKWLWALLVSEIPRSVCARADCPPRNGQGMGRGRDLRCARGGAEPGEAREGNVPGVAVFHRHVWEDLGG